MLTYLVWLIFLHPIVKLASPKMMIFAVGGEAMSWISVHHLSVLVNFLLGKISPIVSAKIIIGHVYRILIVHIVYTVKPSQ